MSVIYKHAVSEFDQVDESSIVTQLFYTVIPDTTHDHYFVTEVQTEIKRHHDNI